jgi:thiosulfate/3-mercaptopyruvate sulfurtransferase
VLPYIIESEVLSDNLSAENLLIVDLGTTKEYQLGHIPGAIHMDVDHLRSGKPPAPGLLPDNRDLERNLNGIGLRDSCHVIAYDHDNNAKACRLMWTLEVVGHRFSSLLNGGFTAWKASGCPIDVAVIKPDKGAMQPAFNDEVFADRECVLDSLGNPGIVILDARSPEEYYGQKSPSLRKGHIPGSVNLNWLDTIDLTNNRKFKPPAELLRMLEARGISKDKEIIVHCQTHQRSSHSFVMLRSLGFTRIRGYAGSWSEWGNDPSLPIE